ncbi:MAG: hypothetical protein AAF984_08535 [Verrucomicrobiota bacterium]
MGDLENPTEVEFFYRSNDWRELNVADICKGYELSFSEGDTLRVVNLERAHAPESMEEKVVLTYYSINKQPIVDTLVENSNEVMEIAIELFMEMPGARERIIREKFYSAV